MSIVISQETKRRWNKAIEKAKAVKPHVTILGFGEFRVCGGAGKDCYTVNWTGGKGQELKATCNCTAGINDVPCYHIPATAGMFKLQVRERAGKARLCTECGEATGYKVAHPDTDYCQECVEAQWESELENMQSAIEAGTFQPRMSDAEIIERSNKLMAEIEANWPADGMQSALVPCTGCGQEHPEAEMTGAGYNLLCSDCLLFGAPAPAPAPKPLERWEASPRRFREEE